MAANSERLDFDHRLADNSSPVSELDARITEFTPLIQHLEDQRALLLDERNSLQRSHPALSTGGALQLRPLPNAYAHSLTRSPTPV